MSQYNIPRIQKKLKKELDEDRYRHTLGVMYTSASLAMCYGADLEKAQVAGLLHDCAKCIPNEKKIKLCEKYQIPISRVEKGAPFLLHSKLGAYLCQSKYQVEDEEIRQAITWHTTGRPAMTLLEKIVFLADYIEPMRWKAENLEEIRRMAFRDLDRAVYMTLRDTLGYLEKGSGELDEMTETAYRYYAKLCGQSTLTAGKTEKEAEKEAVSSEKEAEKEAVLSEKEAEKEAVQSGKSD